MLCLLLLNIGLAQAVTVQRVDLVPAGDGEICGSSETGIYKKISSTINDSVQVLEFKVGEIWNENCKSILEFYLAENLNQEDIVSAELFLSLNGKYGSYPDKLGAGPEAVIYYYISLNANENVSMEDNDGGILLGKAFGNNQKLSKSNSISIKINVTNAVVAAVNSTNIEVLGFRIEKVLDSGKNSAWRIRSSEFGQKFGIDYSPYLLIKLK